MLGYLAGPFQYIPNDFKQKSPNLNNSSKNGAEGGGIEPGYPRSEGSFNIFGCSSKDFRLFSNFFKNFVIDDICPIYQKWCLII